MGYGEVGGNGSVHWRFQHHNADGTKRPIQAGTGGGNPANDKVNFPGGDARGKDAIPAADIGARTGHKGWFVVTLRYRTMAEASAAGSWVADNVSSGPGGYYLAVKVPAITNRPDFDQDPPYEIRIDW